MNSLTPFIRHNMDNLPNETHGRADANANQNTWASHCIPSRQKNALSYLKGETPGVMASYAPETRDSDSCQEDSETVLRLLEWREQAPYG